MWALKGTLIGISIFAVGTAVFSFLSYRNISGGQQMSVDIRMIPLTTIYNPWFWTVLAASIVIGLAIARSWPGKFSPMFWTVLAVIDLFPAGMLALTLFSRSQAQRGNKTRSVIPGNVQGAWATLSCT